MRDLFLILLLAGSLLGAGCLPTTPEDDTTTTETSEEELISVVGTWTLTFWDERYPDTPISTTGTFFADGTAKTNYPAHYTIEGNQITVTADNETTTSVGIIEDANTISGTWEYPEKGTKGTWEGERIWDSE